MEWQPIETAPKDGRHILVWSSGDECEMVYFCRESNMWATSWESDLDYNNLCIPKFWMPLPQPPAD